MFYAAMQHNIDAVMMQSVTQPAEEFLKGSEQISSAFSKQMYEFSVGAARYRFVHPIIVNSLPSREGWNCFISDVSNYAGTGDSAQEAFEQLKISIHVDFQRLSRKRPFEMDEKESANWLQLANLIDVLHYKRTTPVVVREVGCISYGMVSYPYRIKWLSGRNYIIELEKVPGELMSCRTGQWIEAVVKRDPVTHREIEIESISKISFRTPNESEAREFWADMPEADLGMTDWTW
jgi:hypothetical protein